MVCKPFKFWCPTPAGGYGDQTQFKKIFVALIKKPKPSILPCRSTKIKPLLDQPFF